MLFVYKGKDPRIQEEYARYSQAINQRYSNFLSKSHRLKLEEANEKILTQGSFAETPEQFKEKTGVVIANNSPAKFAILITSNDKESHSYSAPLIYMSENAFKNSGYSAFTSNPLATYIHEFDHYVLYALQNTPIESMRGVLTDRLGFNPDGNIEGSLEKLLFDPTKDRFTKAKNISMLLYFIHLKDQFEKATHLLDSKITPAIGASMPLKWRGVPKRMSPLFLPTGTTIMHASMDTDPFYGLSDREAIERFVNWEDHLRINSNVSEIRELVDVAKKKKFDKLSIEEIHALVKEE